jgi:long-chain acyl-CoA synthetase
VTTLCAVFQATAAERPERLSLRSSDGRIEMTWSQAASEVRRLAGALAAHDVKPRDTVALLLRNRPEFNLIDAAALHLGAVPWSIYQTSSAEQIRDLLTRAGSKIIVTEERFERTLEEALDGLEIEYVLRVEEHRQWRSAPAGFNFDDSWRQVADNDLLTLIWTSGTTGPPKGVELTHKAMLATLDALARVAPIQAPGRVVSYLPAAHVADRWAAHYLWTSYGHELTTVADATELMATLASVRPTFWGSVPRVFEKLQAALEAQGIDAPDQLADDAKRAIRRQLGLDHARFLVVGAAPLATELHDFFAALGLPLCEVWGMSETCGLLTVNPPDARRIGTVGPPLPGVELRIASDGEVLARGPMVMRGYRGEPERTGEAIDSEKWLHTGDIGTVDADGYLTIVDRKKELIINAGGKNMSPLAIESALKTAGPLIGQACVIGDRRPYNVALLLLDPDAGASWATANGRQGAGYTQLTSDRELQAAVAEEVHGANARLSRPEQIKRWALLEEDWTASGDELTPTMKLKRRAIEAKHAATIDALYVGEPIAGPV